MEIRCRENGKFGEVTEGATGEFQALCRSRFCKLSDNEVVIHIWNLGKIDEDGIIRPTETKRYKKP